jgi:hypothetical protein
LAEALILDSEALNALANPGTRGSLSVRARAIAQVAHERGALVRVPAPVLAEVCRGLRFDAAVNVVLNRGAIAVTDLTREISQRAGALLARARMSSANAIDVSWWRPPWWPQLYATTLIWNDPASSKCEVRSLSLIAPLLCLLVKWTGQGSRWASSTVDQADIRGSAEAAFMVIIRRELPRTGLVGRATQRIRGSSYRCRARPLTRPLHRHG